MAILRTLILVIILPVLAHGQTSREEDKLSIYEIVQPDGFFGTGFMIEDSLMGQLLITCRHIIQKENGEFFDKIFVRKNKLLKTKQVISDTIGFFVYLKDKKDGKTRRFFYSHPDPNIDLAIIPLVHPDQPIKTRRPVYTFDADLILSKQGLDSLGIEEGTDVEIIGFSLTNSLYIDRINYHFSRFGKIGLFTTDDFELTIDEKPRQANFMLLSMSVKIGDSGSPIIAHIGDSRFIIGIVTAVVPDIAYGVGYPSYYIYDFLQEVREDYKDKMGLTSQASKYGWLEVFKAGE
jgi:hypothetical protein